MMVVRSGGEVEGATNHAYFMRHCAPSPHYHDDYTTGDLTLREFLKYMEDQYGLKINMLSYGVSILYSFFASKKCES